MLEGKQDKNLALAQVEAPTISLPIAASPKAKGNSARCVETAIDRPTVVGGFETRLNLQRIVTKHDSLSKYSINLQWLLYPSGCSFAPSLQVARSLTAASSARSAGMRELNVVTSQVILSFLKILFSILQSFSNFFAFCRFAFAFWSLYLTVTVDLPGWPGSARLNSSRPVESARGVYTLVRSEARQLPVVLQRNGDLQLYSICRVFGMRFVPEMEMLPSIWEAKAWVLKSDLVAWYSKRSKAFWFCKDEHAKRSTEDVDDDEKRPKGTAMPLMPKSDTGTRMRLFEHAGRRDMSWVLRVCWGSVALEKSNCQRSWKKD